MTCPVAQAVIDSLQEYGDDSGWHLLLPYWKKLSGPTCMAFFAEGNAGSHRLDSLTMCLCEKYGRPFQR